MSFFVVLLAIIVLWLIFSPVIKPWLRRRAERQVADYFRSRMGMPTEKEMRRRQKEAEKQSRRQQRASGVRNGFWSRPADHGGTSPFAAPKEIIPREYAVDVEFTEIRTFTQTTIAPDNSPNRGKSHITIESQVSDVEYVEIKFKGAS
ncbi:MAG: hypothetical protein K2F87_04235 [Muribaculaceae bacterium]|nr:hypothetical protein [Muribaculaceae bacterium]